jgi:hypothetical protein
MNDKEDMNPGAKPSGQARRPPQPSEPSSTDSRAVALDTMGSGLSPESSEDEDGSLSGGMDEDSPGGSAKSSSAAVKADPEDLDATEQNPSSTNAPSMPVQKRRRVTRACDECRRKKIKCDGKQPCTHCSVYSYGKDISFPRQRALTWHSVADRGPSRMHL